MPDYRFISEPLYFFNESSPFEKVLIFGHRCTQNLGQFSHMKMKGIIFAIILCNFEIFWLKKENKQKTDPLKLQNLDLHICKNFMEPGVNSQITIKIFY